MHDNALGVAAGTDGHLLRSPLMPNFGMAPVSQPKTPSDAKVVKDEFGQQCGSHSVEPYAQS